MRLFLDNHLILLNLSANLCLYGSNKNLNKYARNPQLIQSRTANDILTIYSYSFFLMNVPINKFAMLKMVLFLSILFNFESV